MQAPRSHRILVAVDRHTADRLASYLASLLGGGAGLQLVLFHLLPPMPTELLEHGGGRDAAEETRIEADQEARVKAWIESATQAAQPVLTSVQGQLEAAGFAVGSIETLCSDTIPEDRAADMILNTAGTLDCGTIVVGRSSLPWLRERFHRHLGEELARRASGFSVLIVE